MRHWNEEPEHARGGGAMGLLAAGQAGLGLVALALPVGSVVADALPVLDPARLLAAWAAR